MFPVFSIFVKTPFKLILLMSVALSILNACGGGGDAKINYNLSGTVSGVVLENVTITLTNTDTNASTITTTDVSGNFSFTALPYGTYKVTPTLSRYTFNPANIVVSMNVISPINFSASRRFTKVCNSGELAGELSFGGTCPDDPSLGSATNQWGCTQDNNTGLTWEVKTEDGGLRDWTNTYTNYDNATQAQKWNGVIFVNPTQPEIDAETNTLGFVNAVNTATLCSHSDWRLPSYAPPLNPEFIEITDNVAQPAFDTTWFPNTQSSWYWTSEGDLLNSYNAFYIDFSYGSTGVSNRDSGVYVRLVRPDTTAPMTTLAPAVSGTTDTSTMFSVTITENGTGYYLVLPKATPAPIVAEVMADTSFPMIVYEKAAILVEGLTPGTEYVVYFVAKDARGNIQAAVQSVPVTTLPAGYVLQGGLTWMPVTITGNWADAVTYCTGSINGIAGWRQPTDTELTDLYNSGAMGVPEWTLSSTWSSTPFVAGSHVILDLSNGFSGSALDGDTSPYVSCVLE